MRATAAAYDEAGLRSLDAVHLATAEILADTDELSFVTYDRRLLDAAGRRGLTAVSPGHRGR